MSRVVDMHVLFFFCPLVPSEFIPSSAINHMSTDPIRIPTLENGGEDGEDRRGSLEEREGDAAGL